MRRAASVLTVIASLSVGRASLAEEMGVRFGAAYLTYLTGEGEPYSNEDLGDYFGRQTGVPGYAADGLELQVEAFLRLDGVDLFVGGVFVDLANTDDRRESDIFGSTDAEQWALRVGAEWHAARIAPLGDALLSLGPYLAYVRYEAVYNGDFGLDGDPRSTLLIDAGAVGARVGLELPLAMGFRIRPFAQLELGIGLYHRSADFERDGGTTDGVVVGDVSDVGALELNAAIGLAVAFGVPFEP